jgi:hypothetical protein
MVFKESPCCQALMFVLTCYHDKNELCYSSTTEVVTRKMITINKEVVAIEIKYKMQCNVKTMSPPIDILSNLCKSADRRF